MLSVDANAARLITLAILTRWHRSIVWKVRFRLASGGTGIKLFKREAAAREWASMLADADIEEINYSVREQSRTGTSSPELDVDTGDVTGRALRNFEFVDTEVHYVVNS